MATGQARIWWDTDIQFYRMTTPYDEGFTELFKACIPHSDRNWDKPSKIWTFSERYFSPIKSLMEKSFNGNVVIISKEQTEKAAQPLIKTLPIDQVLAQFVKLLPHEAMQKAYRHAAMMFHPDRNPGDESAVAKMATINAAWQRLEVEFYKVKKGE